MSRETQAVCCWLLCAGIAFAQKDAPVAPPENAKPQVFHDKQFGVRFEVPAGWSFVRRDREVSTFLLDARSATPRSEMRGVASINFNPFPLSTFSGALFYFSVQRHTNDRECEGQALRFGEAQSGTQTIGGMDFVQGHDEHGDICVESRDEVYTAYRKGSCYRFDLTVNTFCSVSSGATEMTRRQFDTVEQRMDDILGTVAFDFKPPARRTPSPERKRLPVPEARPRPAQTLGGST